MKLKKTFIVNSVAGETICVPVSGEFHGIVKANSTAAFILECLKSETSIDGIVDRMLDEYLVEREKAEHDVRKIVAQLEEIGAIEE